MMSERELRKTIRFIRDLFWILLSSICCAVSICGIVTNDRLMTNIPIVIFMFFVGIYIAVGNDDEDE